MKGRCYLKTGLGGPRRSSQSPELGLAMNLAKPLFPYRDKTFQLRAKNKLQEKIC